MSLHADTFLASWLLSRSVCHVGAGSGRPGVVMPAVAGENIQINDLAAARATALLIGIPSEFSSLGQGHVERGLGENAVDLETEGGSPS